MRVYADFMGVIRSQRGDTVHAVVLDCFGTVLDLCAARVRLRDGLRLTLYSDSSEAEDLEVEATARWYVDVTAKNGGYWVGEYDAESLHEVARNSTEGGRSRLLCYACGGVLSTDSSQLKNLLMVACPECAARPIDVIAAPDPRGIRLRREQG